VLRLVLPLTGDSFTTCDAFVNLRFDFNNGVANTVNDTVLVAHQPACHADSTADASTPAPLEAQELALTGPNTQNLIPVLIGSGGIFAAGLGLMLFAQQSRFKRSSGRLRETHPSA
jgi:hypothetical protein